MKTTLKLTVTHSNDLTPKEVKDAMQSLLSEALDLANEPIGDWEPNPVLQKIQLGQLKFAKPTNTISKDFIL